MATQLFRKAALERLSTPEQLDRAVSVTSPKAWVALGALMVIALAVLTWSIVGEVRTRVAANGILLVVGGQVLDAVATASGTLADVAVGIGDSVEAGATIATVVNPEAVERHRGAVSALVERRAMHAALEASLRVTDEASEAAAARARERTRNLVALAREKIAASRDRLADHEALFEEKVVTRVTVDRSRQEYQQALRELSDALTRLDDIETRELSRRAESQSRLDESESRVSQAERTIAELEATLATARVVAPVSGRITEIKAYAGDVVQPGTRVASIEAGGTGLEVLIYIPPENGKRVDPDMPALVSPITVRREEIGALRGVVIDVSEFPVTNEGIMTVLQNSDLARTFTQNGAPYAGRVRLIPDPDTVSGYAWTSPKGADFLLTSGTLASVEITVKVQPPIAMVVPLIREALSL